jgi:8-oxo-dGTP pyrophosphatase MutT (NUDIX family)
MNEPTTPRPASSVILLRRGGDPSTRIQLAQDDRLMAAIHGRHTPVSDRGIEVLMVRRNPAARFMPGIWVFPGGGVDGDDGEGEGGHRAAAVREMEEEAGVQLDPAELVLYSRWITPEFVSTRFNTYFYLALAPPHSEPKPDGSETVDAGWFEPAVALERHAADEMPLVFPTIKHLESLLEFSNAAEAIEAARSRDVKPIMPRVVGEGKERRIVID